MRKTYMAPAIATALIAGGSLCDEILRISGQNALEKQGGVPDDVKDDNDGDNLNKLTPGWE